MNEKILSYTNCVLTDKGCSAAISEYPLPPCNASFDSDNIQEALNTVLSWQKHQRVLVITDSLAFCNLLLAVNQTLQKGKLVVYCDGVFHDEDALLEIERGEDLLHTSAGSEHYPYRQLTDNLYVDEEGCLLLKDSENGTNQLFSVDGSFWGCTLDPVKFKANRMIGELLNHLDKLCLRDRAIISSILLAMADANTFSSVENLLLFRTESGFELLDTGAPISYDSKALISLLYMVFFNHDADEQKDKLDMLIQDRFIYSDYPAFLFEDFTAAYSASIFPSSKLHYPVMKLLRNSIERILISTKEELK